MSDSALGTAMDWLLERQQPAGWWTAEMETNVTMTAEHLLLLRFLGADHEPIAERLAAAHPRQAARRRQLVALLRRARRPQHHGRGIRRAPPARPGRRRRSRCARARRFILAQGGLAQARVFTKLWLALFGQYPWDGVPSMPPELIHLPSRAPLNLYDFACWARGTIAPLLIVLSRRPVRPLGFDVQELVAPGTEAAAAPGARHGGVLVARQAPEDV